MSKSIIAILSLVAVVAVAASPAAADMHAPAPLTGPPEGDYGNTNVAVTPGGDIVESVIPDLAPYDLPAAVVGGVTPPSSTGDVQGGGAPPSSQPFKNSEGEQYDGLRKAIDAGLNNSGIDVRDLNGAIDSMIKKKKKAEEKEKERKKAAEKEQKKKQGETRKAKEDIKRREIQTGQLRRQAQQNIRNRRPTTVRMPQANRATPRMRPRIEPRSITIRVAPGRLH